MLLGEETVVVSKSIRDDCILAGSRSTTRFRGPSTSLATPRLTWRREDHYIGKESMLLLRDMCILGMEGGHSGVIPLEMSAERSLQRRALQALDIQQEIRRLFETRGAWTNYDQSLFDICVRSCRVIGLDPAKWIPPSQSDCSLAVTVAVGPSDTRDRWVQFLPVGVNVLYNMCYDNLFNIESERVESPIFPTEWSEKEGFRLFRGLNYQIMEYGHHPCSLENMQLEDHYPIGVGIEGAPFVGVVVGQNGICSYIEPDDRYAPWMYGVEAGCRARDEGPMMRESGSKSHIRVYVGSPTFSVREGFDEYSVLRLQQSAEEAVSYRWEIHIPTSDAEIGLLALDSVMKRAWLAPMEADVMLVDCTTNIPLQEEYGPRACLLRDVCQRLNGGAFRVRLGASTRSECCALSAAIEDVPDDTHVTLVMFAGASLLSRQLWINIPVYTPQKMVRYHALCEEHARMRQFIAQCQEWYLREFACYVDNTELEPTFETGFLFGHDMVREIADIPWEYLPELSYTHSGPY